MDIKTTLWLITDGILLAFLLLFLGKWIIREVRSISEDVKGFIKFTQITFILGSWLVFLLIFFYYLMFDPNETLSILGLFLTIVVGFLGTIMGLFFSSEALNEMKRKYDYRGEKLHKLRETLDKIKENLLTKK